MNSEASVLCRKQGKIGRITLNRPQVLNALDRPMIEAMLAALEQWRGDDSVHAVVLDGAGERAFCAGGDIAVVHESAQTDPEIARELWRTEYRLDALLARFPKPVVTLMDGITMGGGLGIGGHANLRIVTERTVLAMPEVMIGLAPDVGSALLLSHAPGELGTHIALTAARIGAADAVYCGLADHVAHSTELPALIEDLSATGTLPRVGNAHSAGELSAQREWIDACYGGTTDIGEIRERLRSHGHDTAADAIESAAPTAIAVTLLALRAAREMSGIEECLRQDFRLCSRFLAHPDLREGIRAAILDKDHAPRWERETGDIARFFAPLDDEL